jgi:nucleotide-binding universal stress UspA family protein
VDVVLVATDFSSLSRRAEDLGHRLAQAMGARLHLLHVIEPIDDPETADEETREFHRTLEEKARAQLEEAAARLTGVEVTFSVVLGRPSQSVLLEAEARGASLIVVGSTPIAEGQPPRLSTGQQVAWFATRPVLLVP